MNYSVILYKKTIDIELSTRADKMLRGRDEPITAVMHLIFGCMVAKRVWFKDQVDVETTPVNDKLNLAFNVVRYANCSLKNIDSGAEPESFPIAKDVKIYVPDYLFINYKKGKFSGEFTYHHAVAVEQERFDEKGRNMTGNVVRTA